MLSWIVNWYNRKRTPAREESGSHRVRDLVTGRIIAIGDKDKCEAYVSAFGLCYMEEIYQ